MAARVGIGKDTVARIWADHGLQPWKVTTFKISNVPRFEDKLVARELDVHVVPSRLHQLRTTTDH
jgi:hypothetical protein